MKTVMTTTEQQPTRAALRDRLRELIAVKEALAGDIDDARVVSEYTAVTQQIAKLKATLWPQP